MMRVRIFSGSRLAMRLVFCPKALASS
jgi:hypothetical protein